MEFFPSSFSSPSSPSFFLYLSGMPPSLLGETQPLLAFEVKVVHKRLIVQRAWLNYGLQMGLSHWSVNGHHISCGWWAGVLAGHWWQTCWSLTSGKYSQLGTICGPGCGSYEALWCWEEMRSQVETGWGLEANLICLSCFWDPWTSFPCDLLPPCSRLEVWEWQICLTLAADKILMPLFSKMSTSLQPEPVDMISYKVRKDFGLPWWLSGKEYACQCRRHGFNPWVGKILWRKEWQPNPVFLPGKSHGQRSLVGYSPRSHRRVGHDLVTKQRQQKGLQVWLRTLRGIICVDPRSLQRSL